jgi:hypothetical protein
MMASPSSGVAADLDDRVGHSEKTLRAPLSFASRKQS